MTTGLCSLSGPPRRYELPGTEPCRGATWCEVPETMNLSSFPRGVAAVMADLALLPGGAWCETPVKARRGEVAALPVLQASRPSFRWFFSVKEGDHEHL